MFYFCVFKQVPNDLFVILILILILIIIIIINFFVGLD